MHFFMMNRITMLMLKDYKIKKTLISMRILQELLLSFILYLFYAAELLKTCNDTSERLSAGEFIDDISLLVYRLFTERNCHMLSRAHDKCLDWIRCYRISFNLKKYELIHLSCTLCRFNMRVLLQVENKALALKPLI